MADQSHKSQGYWRLVWRQFKQRKLALASVVLLAALCFIGLIAPFLAGEIPIYLEKDGKSYVLPNVFSYTDLVSFSFDGWEPGPDDTAIRPLIPYAPERSNLRHRLEPPSAEHWLGTDDRGRDVMSRIIWGTRISMTVGVVAMGIAVLIGVFAGSLAGYYGGAVDRLVRGEFLKLRSADFTTAARATGLSDMRVMFRHLLPNALAPVLVAATFGVAGAILTESALSFLGFGVPPPTASWGEILKQSKENVEFAYWLVIFPGIAIFMTVTAFNLAGEGLRDAMDPRLRQ